MADYISKGETFSITDPGKMEEDGRSNLIMFNGLKGFAFDLDLPINEEWSDLTVQFEFIKKSKGYLINTSHFGKSLENNLRDWSKIRFNI